QREGCMDTTLSLIKTLLNQIYAMEKSILENLPMMADKATSPRLKQIFHDHHSETRKQINRLEDVFDKLELDYPEESEIHKLLGKGKKILKEMAHVGAPSKEELLASLIAENRALFDLCAREDNEIQDTVLAVGGQQIEQLEIGCYELLIRLVQRIEHNDAEDLLKTNLNEEIHARQVLSQISSLEPLTFIH
ncbi:MAG: ferritin-like domain-containing protein, partial [Parachlamydia sp.]|nr:ferritin-like domain-containing protein [Parachlamydia sp.]